MKALVVYDSSYGNTEALARAIGEAAGEGATVISAAQAGRSDFEQLDVLIVGSPTQGGRPTASLTKLLTGIPANGLGRTLVAAFDTRFAAAERGLGLRLLMKVIGYAAPRIAKTLEEKGGRLAAPPEGFIVEDKEGPLKPGELKRASEWANVIVSHYRQQIT